MGVTFSVCQSSQDGTRTLDFMLLLGSNAFIREYPIFNIFFIFNRELQEKKQEETRNSGYIAYTLKNV